MIRARLIEHGRVHCWKRPTPPPEPTLQHLYLPQRFYRALQETDLGRPQGPALSWSLRYGSVGQWVGVMNVPGLQLEILPKLDVHDDEAGVALIRRNLLHMLGVAGMVPIRQVDLARLSQRKAPLTEILIRIFAHRLQAELQRGLDRRYVHREDDIRAFKGKLLVDVQVRRFAARKERFHCRFDEFSADTPMNQVFRAVCRLLMTTTRAAHTAESLRRCLLLMSDVSNREVTVADVDRIVIDRKSERFADILGFCRLVLSGRSPTADAGDLVTYSLLFDMNQVFERFIANFMRRHVIPSFPDTRILAQARGNRRPLVRDVRHRGAAWLKPDLLLLRGGRALVIDTKWKALASSTRPTSSDLYQLFAYTKRYASRRSVLLYPDNPEFRPDTLFVQDAEGPSGETIEVRSVNLSRDLWSRSERDALAQELRSLLSEGALFGGTTENRAVGEMA